MDGKKILAIVDQFAHIPEPRAPRSARAHGLGFFSRKAEFRSVSSYEFNYTGQSAIEQAVRAYADYDIELAQQIITEDANINAKRFEIEESCLHIMVTHQPVAGGLRMIVTSMNIVTEMECMGDHAAGIARLAVRVEEVPKREAPGGIFHIAAQCRDMLRRAVEAFIQRDASKSLRCRCQR